MSPTTAVIVALALLVGNAFFVGAEFALVSARRTKMEQRADDSRLATTALTAMEDLTSVIAAAQLGITACSLGLGAVAEPAIASQLEPVLEAIGIPHGWLHPIALTISLAIVMSIHVVLGEMVPKNLALAGPERAAVIYGAPMLALVRLFRPLIWVLNVIANNGIRIFGVEPRAEVASSFTHEEVEALVDESHSEGLIEDSEYERLAGALGFTSRTVADVVLDVSELLTVSRDSRAEEVEAQCAASGFSRFPVTDEDGDLIGYLHIKDVLSADPQGRARPIDTSAIHPFATVLVTDPLLEALRVLRDAGAHMAKVTNAAGDLVGVATLEDVLELLIGEVHDAAHHAESAQPGG